MPQKVNGAVLFPAFELAEGAKVIADNDLPNSACFREREECFRLIYAADAINSLMYLVLENDETIRVYKFYTNSIDNVFVKENKLYVVFVDQTELFGWIEWETGEYVFRMFFDPELQ